MERWSLISHNREGFELEHVTGGESLILRINETE